MSGLAINVIKRNHKALRSPHTNFERKAWLQSDKKNNAWVWACPRGDLMLNARWFIVVIQTFFGVK